MNQPAASFLALTCTMAIGLLGTACDRQSPSESAPNSEITTTPAPIAASPLGSQDETHAAKAPLASVRDPRLLPWMEEYANTEREEDRSGSIYRIAEQARLGAPAEEVVAALVEVFLREESATLKSEILGHLTKLNHPSALPAITRGLAADQPPEVRLATVWTLQFLADEKSLPTLRRALSDPDSNVRDAAQDAVESLTENP